MKKKKKIKKLIDVMNANDGTRLTGKVISRNADIAIVLCSDGMELTFDRITWNTKGPDSSRDTDDKWENLFPVGKEITLHKYETET